MAHLDVFEYDPSALTVRLVKETIFLEPTFRSLLDNKRLGKYKSIEDRMIKEFTYMYLMYDIMSIYVNYDESKRLKRSVEVSGLSDKELADPCFIAAADKYKELNDTFEARYARSMKIALERNRRSVEDIDFLDRGIDIKKTLDSFQSMEKAIRTINNLTEEGRLKVINGRIQGDSLPGFREDG